eukprot:1158630-Pelagomonas_calceolata.AAC.4
MEHRNAAVHIWQPAYLQKEINQQGNNLQWSVLTLTLSVTVSANKEETEATKISICLMRGSLGFKLLRVSCQKQVLSSWASAKLSMQYLWNAKIHLLMCTALFTTSYSMWSLKRINALGPSFPCDTPETSTVQFRCARASLFLCASCLPWLMEAYMSKWACLSHGFRDRLSMPLGWLLGWAMFADKIPLWSWMILNPGIGCAKTW